LEFWLPLRKEARLNLSRDLEFVGGAALRLALRCDGTPLRLHSTADFIEADERVGIPIDVLETGEGATPRRRVVGG